MISDMRNIHVLIITLSVKWCSSICNKFPILPTIKKLMAILLSVDSSISWQTWKFWRPSLAKSFIEEKPIFKIEGEDLKVVQPLKLFIRTIYMKMTRSREGRPWGWGWREATATEGGNEWLRVRLEVQSKTWGWCWGLKSKEKGEGLRSRVRVLKEREDVSVRLTRSRRHRGRLWGTEGEALEVQSKTWGWWGSKSKEKGEGSRSRVRVLRERAREKRFKRIRNEIQFKRPWGSGLACVRLGHLDCKNAFGPFQSP